MPAEQRVSCHAMNAPVPERVAPRTNKNKAEPGKAEPAQVVTDSMTGRTYSRGKLLGKVRLVLPPGRLVLPPGSRAAVCLAGRTGACLTEGGVLRCAC